MQTPCHVVPFAFSGAKRVTEFEFYKNVTWLANKITYGERYRINTGATGTWKQERRLECQSLLGPLPGFFPPALYWVSKLDETLWVKSPSAPNAIVK